MSDISAFPYVIPSTNGGFYWTEGGMTLRDYFAGQALGACINTVDYYGDAPIKAYRIADAMMKVREKKE